MDANAIHFAISMVSIKKERKKDFHFNVLYDKKKLIVSFQTRGKWNYFC